MRTELGRSQVEVQQCALSWEVGEELVGKAEVEVEVDADMVEEKLEEEEKEEEDNSSDKI